MKNLFKAIVLLTNCFMLVACDQSVSVPLSATTSATTTPIVSPTAIPVTPIPSPTTTETLIPTATQGYVPPTLIPTIDPALVPDLLSRAFSIQALEGPNGHAVRKITGWDRGFGNIQYPYYCPGYSWLDPHHLLLYPVTGQEPGGEGWSRYNLVPQPVVVNLETGAVWLPPVQPENYGTCHKVYSAPELEIVINAEVHNDTSTVSTYTYDGQKLASYPGSIIDISPSGTKILLEQDTLLDLRTDRRITLDWSLEDYNQFDLTGLFWTADEKRAYRCCYFYADLTTGTSYRFERSDFQFTDGTHLDPDGLWFYRGQWIRNDTYFLAEWSWIDDGDIRYLPMLDPAKKIFYDVRERAGISEDWSCQETVVSPDGKYVWMTGWGKEEEGNYLVDLFTFESQYYPGKMYLHIDWSPNSKFAWLYSESHANKTNQYSILSITDQKISPLPVNPLYDWSYWWHETKDILAYPSEDKNNLVFLDASTMSFQQLPFTIQGPEYSSGKLAWSPSGEKIGFVAGDGSLWQVHYPKSENAEQLTPSFPDVYDVNWSPDGNSIAFVSGSDIYIVDTMK